MTLSPRAIRVERLLPVFIGALVFAVASWAATSYPVGVFHDDGVYVILAKALATGDGYRYLHLPDAPFATHYPPGYPLVLSVLWRLVPEFPRNTGVFLAANAAFLALAAVGILTFARRVLAWPTPAAAAAAVVATLSFPLLILSGHVLSETMFLALLLPALLLAERHVKAAVPDLRRALVLGAAAGALILVRTHAVALLPAVLLPLALERRWREAALVTAAATAVVAPWQWWVATHDAALAEGLRGSYGSYGAWISDGIRGGGSSLIAGTIAANVREVGSLLSDRFSLSDRGLPRSLAAIAASGLILAGSWRSLRRAPVTVAFTVTYVGILLVFPYAPWRFFFAIWPLTILLLGEGIRWSLEARTRLPAVALPVVALSLLLAAGAVRAESRSYRNRAWRQPARVATSQIGPVVRWVAGKTRMDDIVAVDGEQLVYLFTGRRAVPIAPFTAREYIQPRGVPDNAASMRRLLGDLPVSFVLTVQPAFLAAAKTLVADGAATGARLIPLDLLPGGGAFRVERPELPLPR